MTDNFWVAVFDGSVNCKLRHHYNSNWAKQHRLFFSMWRWYVRIETTVTKPSAVELPGTGKLLWDVFPVPTAIIAHVIHNAIVLSTELLFKYNSRYKLSRRCYLTQWIKQVKKKKFSEGNKPMEGWNPKKPTKVDPQYFQHDPHILCHLPIMHTQNSLHDIH